MNRLPIYNEDTPAKPGLYLGLFHGREDPEKKLDGWGFNGPIIGPLNHVHTTYLSHIKIEFETPQEARNYGFDPGSLMELVTDDDMVLFQGKWYGDWIVYYYKISSLPALKDITFDSNSIDEGKAKNQIITTTQYWDCDCNIDYIQPYTQKHCAVCNRNKEDCSNSRVTEVLQHKLPLNKHVG